MSGDDARSGEPGQPDALEIFDVLDDERLACRVCGALVAAGGDYPRTHWDWHEAANGA